MSASGTDLPESDDAALRDVAARWVVRQDRRLTTAETAEFEAWLSANPQHAQAFVDAKSSWHFFRNLGTTVRRAPVVSARRKWPVATGVAAAAALALAFFSFERNFRSPTAAIDQPAPVLSEQAGMRVLKDGSVVRLKDGAQIVEASTDRERRVRLLGGDAFFIVAKHQSRPFFVEAGGVTVRAVGTAFAVRCAPQTVDVVVTEGIVDVSPPEVEVVSQPAASLQVAPAIVRAGNRARIERVVANGRQALVAVTAISGDEIDRTLAWSGRMLELAGATLEELVAEFSRRSGQTLRLGDATLKGVRVGGRFPVDDVDGFVRALEEIYQIKCERQSDGAFVLKLR